MDFLKAMRLAAELTGAIVELAKAIHAHRAELEEHRRAGGNPFPPATRPPA